MRSKKNNSMWQCLGDRFCLFSSRRWCDCFGFAGWDCKGGSTILTILIILIITIIMTIVILIMTIIILIITTLPGFPCSIRPVQWEPNGKVDGHPPGFTSWASAQNWDGDEDGDQDDDNDNNLGIYRFLGTQLQTWCLLLPAGENFPQISQKQETIW